VRPPDTSDTSSVNSIPDSTGDSKSSVIELPELQGGITPFNLSIEGGGHEKAPPTNEHVFETDVFIS
jgi:hypothetical protein